MSKPYDQVVSNREWNWYKDMDDNIYRRGLMRAVIGGRDEEIVLTGPMPDKVVTAYIAGFIAGVKNYAGPDVARIVSGTVPIDFSDLDGLTNHQKWAEMRRRYDARRFRAIHFALAQQKLDYTSMKWVDIDTDTWRDVYPTLIELDEAVDIASRHGVYLRRM